MRKTLLSLAPLAALLVAGCAGTDPQAARPVAERGPLELMGLMVLSADGSRTLGEVEDVVVGPGGRAEQLVVATSTPMVPNTRRVTVDVDETRFSTARHALMLDGVTLQQVAVRSGFDETGMVAVGGIDQTRDPTNWHNATMRGN